MKIINEIKNEYRKNKVVTGFMGIMVIISILSYLRPSSTTGILNYLGFTAINFITIATLLIILWWFYGRKNGK